MIRLRRVLAAAVLVLAASGADGASAPSPAGAQQGGDLGAYGSIVQRGVLGGESDGSSGTVSAQPPVSWRLIGTLEGGGRSGAVLDDGTGAQAFYRIGQKLPDDSRITQVRRDRVLIKRSDGSVAELFTSDDGMPPTLPAVPADGTVLSPPADSGASGAAQAAGPRPNRRRSSRGED